MKMAKPSAKDIAAAEELQQALNALDQNQRWGCQALEDTPDFFQLIDDDEFDPEQGQHAQALYNKLVTLMWENPSFHNRVISGMCHVIMYEKNEIIDPDSDCIDLHPRFAEMWNDLKRETQAARYWNKRYHQVVAERDEARAKLAAAEKERDYQKSLAIDCAEQCIKGGNEIVDLLAKLAAMESQKPYKYLSPNGELRENCEAKNSDEWGAKFEPLYTKPVAAEKPAVAIDEKTNSRGEPEAIYLQLHDPDSFSENEAADFRADGVTWCWHRINHNDVRYIREDLASPPHSQQSAQEWKPIETAPKDGTEILLCSAVIHDIGLCYWHEGMNGWTWGAGNYFRNPVAWMPLPEPPSADRCPSHESEQS